MSNYLRLNNGAIKDYNLQFGPFNPLCEVAELHARPLKFRFKQLLTADEFLAQTLHPHCCLQQTLVKSFILVL